MVETCNITLTPTTDAEGNPAVVEVKDCTVSVVGNGQSPSGSPTATVASVPTASATGEL